jgi:hypothetical protein
MKTILNPAAFDKNQGVGGRTKWLGKAELNCSMGGRKTGCEKAAPYQLKTAGINLIQFSNGFADVGIIRDLFPLLYWIIECKWPRYLARPIVSINSDGFAYSPLFKSGRDGLGSSSRKNWGQIISPYKGNLNQIIFFEYT